MKKLLLVLLAVITVYSCQKKDGPATPQEVEVEFVIQQTDFGGLKSTNDEVPQCNDALTWDYAEFIFGGTTYTSPILSVGGELLTKVIKLKSGLNYDLTYFVIKHDLTGDGPTGDDPIVRAAPALISDYIDLMEHPLNITVSVEDFIKKQIVIDVLCYEDLWWEAFGFTWFQINDVKIERQCFFGDICTGKPHWFNGSEYAATSQGVQMDMPAIMKIDVFKKVGSAYLTIPDNSFTNKGDFAWDPDAGAAGEFMGFNGEGACMEVYWANDLGLTGEWFKFELSIWLPQSGVFDWVPYHTWEFQDDDCPDPSTDGVVDFTLGACQDPDADFIFAPWMNLPTQVTANIYHRGPSYWEIDVLTQTPSAGNFEFGVGDDWLGWCADAGATIGGTGQTFDVFSSLQPGTWPLETPAHISAVKLRVINWLFNNLGTWGATPTNLGAIEGDLQNAIWWILHDQTVVNGYGAENDLYTAAKTHVNYQPPPGGWAGVLLFKNVGGTRTGAQLLMVQVDP